MSESPELEAAPSSSEKQKDSEPISQPEPTPPEGQSEPQPEPTPEGQSEPTPESQPEPTPESQSEPTPEGQSEPTPEGQPEPTPESQSEPTPEGQPEPTPESQPEPTPEGQSESTPGAQAAESIPITPSMSAVVIGGTGAVGRALVCHLLKLKTHCSKVTVIGRRAIDGAVTGDVNIEEETRQGRLVEHVVDMDGIANDDIKTMCEGSDVFFCCLGTTRKAAGSADAFVHIDRDIVMKFATQAKAANIPHFSLVSSVGANPNSFLLYLKTKGEVEQRAQGLDFPYTTILRPGLLDRGEENKRFIEKISGFFMRSMRVTTVAEAMFLDAYQYKKGSAGASANFVLLNNSGIDRIVQESAKTDNK